MELFDLFWISLRTLAKNKLRSGLTVLGVVIGIAAVTAMVSVGQGAGELIQGEFRNLGTNVIIIFPGRVQQSGVREGTRANLTAADAAAVGEECRTVKAVSPIVFTTGQVIGGNVNWKPGETRGVGPDYLNVRNWPLAAGEFITDNDVSGANKVCVIGNTLAVKLFPNADPIGQQLRVKNIPFTVKGLLAKKGANLVGQDQDDILLMPWTTVRKRLQGSTFANVDYMMISGRESASSEETENEIRTLLNERHKIPPGGRSDFEIENTSEIAKIFAIITGTMTAMLSTIAAISLVVGGVGIMNIMLVSVTERTREIGVRMALGARPRDILRQFLVEAVVLSSIGGVIGILIGVSASYGIVAGINALLPNSGWPFIISVPAAVVALVFAAAVGVFFGFYPARRASRLDPIEALRYE